MDDAPDDIVRTPYVLDDHLVEISTQDAADWVCVQGSIWTYVKDGKRYRVLEPWEAGQWPTLFNSPIT